MKLSRTVGLAWPSRPRSNPLIDVLAVRQTYLLSKNLRQCKRSLFLALRPPKLSRGLTEQMTEMTARARRECSSRACWLKSSVRAVKHGNDIWCGMQFTRNRARSQWPSATARKQSAAGRTSPRRKSKSADRTANSKSVAVRPDTHGSPRLPRPYPGQSSIEPDLKCHSAMARSQSPTKSRLALLHTELPRELSGQGYGSRLAHGVFEALRRDGKEVASAPSCHPTRPTPRVRRAPRWLIEDGRNARAHSALDDDTSAYRMHVQREFPISSAASDVACWPANHTRSPPLRLKQ